MKELNMNKIEDLSRLKEAVGNAIDRRIEEIRMDENAESVMKMPFGKLKYLFENISGRLFDTEEGKKAIKEYVTAIKCSKPLTCFHGVFESVCKGVTDDASIHASEAVKMMEQAGRPDERSLKSLREAVCHGLRTVGMSSEEFSNICECYDDSVMKSIDSISGIRRNDLTRKVSILKEIARYMSERGHKKENEEPEDEGSGIGQLSEILSGQYEPWEKDAITEISVGIMAGKQKNEIFDESKDKCIVMLKEAIDETDDENEKARLEEMSDRLMKKEFCEETANDDLFKLSELKSMI